MTTRYRRAAAKKEDFTAFYVRNVMTGEVYETCRAFDKKIIEGVEYTQVLRKGKLCCIRSDSLKRITNT